jgi:hypothetical protein
MPDDPVQRLIKQFACACGCGFGTHPEDIDLHLIDLLRWVEAGLNHDATINSGCRCPRHNAEVGGSKDSAHLRGKAADVAVLNDRERGIVIYWAAKWGCERMEQGLHYVHLDVDPALPRPWFGLNLVSLGG